MNHGESIRQTIAGLLVGFSGQKNTLTIPRTYITLCDGDVLAALLLSQIVYWSDRTEDPDGWFAKSAADWEEEIGLTTYQVSRLVKKLADFGVEKQVKRSKFYGHVPTSHYRIVMEKFSKCVLKKLQNGIARNSQPESEETPKRDVEKLDDAHSEASLDIHSLQTEPTTEPTAHDAAAEGVPDAPDTSGTSPKPSTGVTNSFEKMNWDTYRETVQTALQFQNANDGQLTKVAIALQQQHVMDVHEVRAFGLWYQDKRKNWSSKAHIRKLATIASYVKEFRGDSQTRTHWMQQAEKSGGLAGYAYSPDAEVYQTPESDTDWNAVWAQLDAAAKNGENAL